MYTTKNDQLLARKEPTVKAMSRGILLTLGLAIAFASIAPSVRAQEGATSESAPASGGGQTATVRAGYLSCHVNSGWGFIFGSSRNLRCAYALQPGYTEYYDGSITKFGADIGYLHSAVLLWAVVTPSTNLGQGALEGHYGGATVSAALGVGGGANVMVGGFKDSIALQPISIEGQNGLNVAAGVVGLSLKFDKDTPANAGIGSLGNSPNALDGHRSPFDS